MKNDRGIKVGETDGKVIKNERGIKVAEFDGKDIKNERGIKIGTIDDVKKVIDGNGGVSLVVMWIFFIR